MQNGENKKISVAKNTYFLHKNLYFMKKMHNKNETLFVFAL